ncbi:MAG TPA: hypothetical protein VMX17_08840 [Candidatus Glassbacteria bacterium]|nr:hypothetical protein [Candidatus Glassbacteria bacterium]
MTLKEYREKRMKQKKESRAFKEIVGKRTKAAQRRAYENEAIKAAEERGEELARRPSFKKRAWERTKKIYKSTAPRQPQRVPVRRRVVRKRTYKRRPVRRTMRRASTQATQQAPRRSVIEELF